MTNIDSRARVAMCIVTYNSARFIRACLARVLEQDYPRALIVVIDNASSDQTPEILREFETRVHVIYNRENVGFAAAQNQAIHANSESDWILTLNPDVSLARDFVTRLIEVGDADSAVGSVCGKLLRASPGLDPSPQDRIDSSGIYFTPSLRHFDRGSETADRGQYDRCEYVFGATGAAALYRREMIADVSICGEFFDSDFFAYREDADVAWRAQLLGWKCLYTPLAVAYHVRNVLPSNRRSLPPLINMHSVKNRFLMRIKNTTRALYLRNFWAITLRDIVVIGACLTYEFTSLRAFVIVLRNWRRAWAKRREIMKRRRVDDEYIGAWFSSEPVSYPAREHAGKCASLC